MATEHTGVQPICVQQHGVQHLVCGNSELPPVYGKTVFSESCHQSIYGNIELLQVHGNTELNTELPIVDAVYGNTELNTVNQSVYNQIVLNTELPQIYGNSIQHSAAISMATLSCHQSMETQC